MNGNTRDENHSTDQHHDPRIIVYYVNRERQQTEHHKLTVATILSDAGFVPAAEYTLIRDNGDHKFPDENEDVPLHEEERFTAIFKGPTPTS